jgi:serine/threonine protein kinase
VVSNAQVTQTLTACGTISCSAPEVLRDQRYSLKADIYSFGVCLWAMFTRRKPYPKKTDAQIVIAVAIEGKRLPIPQKMPKEGVKLLKQCWHPDAKTRPTFSQLADAFDKMEVAIPTYQVPTFVTESAAEESLSMSLSSSNNDAIEVKEAILSETARLLD